MDPVAELLRFCKEAHCCWTRRAAAAGAPDMGIPAVAAADWLDQVVSGFLVGAVELRLRAA